MDIPALADARIQAELISDAFASAQVGFLVWDEDGRYIAANDAACSILGTTLTELLGQPVGAHTTAPDVGALIDEALRNEFAQGTATVDRFDGSGPVDVVWFTFTTRSAGLPFMATILARAA